MEKYGNAELNKICDNQETKAALSSSSSDCSRHVDALMTQGITGRLGAVVVVALQQGLNSLLPFQPSQTGR